MFSCLRILGGELPRHAAAEDPSMTESRPNPISAEDEAAGGTENGRVAARGRCVGETCQESLRALIRV